MNLIDLILSPYLVYADVASARLVAAIAQDYCEEFRQSPYTEGPSRWARPRCTTCQISENR